MLSMQKLLTAIMLSVLLAGSAEAAQSLRISNTGVAPLPMRFFCASNPAECTAHRDARAQWSDELHTLLTQVNNQVNRSIRPQANPRRGWTVGPSSGDCNDYVLTKRSRLIAMGVPPGALRMAVTATPRGEKHLILVVKTTSGDVVLDNLSRKVRTLGETGYPIYSISTANPRRWTAG
jgi:predicted transglutaminase-like cysteine proteinase